MDSGQNLRLLALLVVRSQCTHDYPHPHTLPKPGTGSCRIFVITTVRLRVQCDPYLEGNVIVDSY